MRLEEAVYSQLISDSGASGLISDRLYPLQLPQKCPLPAVAYTLVSMERSPALQKDTGFVKAMIQFSCYAKSYEEAVATGKAIKDAMQDFSGDMQGLCVMAVLINLEMALYEESTEEYALHLECEFQFNEE